MNEKRLIVDQTILVSFFTGNPPQQAEKAKALLAESMNGSRTLVLFPHVIISSALRLEAEYSLPFRKVAESLLALLYCKNIDVREEDLIIPALEMHRDQGIPLDLAFLNAAARAEHAALVSFDPENGSLEGVRKVELR
jgi:predicted nucleic acid-binding protein